MLRSAGQLASVRSYLDGLGALGGVRRYVEHFLSLGQGGQGPLGGQKDTLAVDKDLAAVILGDKAISLFEAEPFDPAVELAPIGDPRLAGATQIGDRDLQTSVGHLPLGFDGENKLLAAFAAGDEGIAKSHPGFFLLSFGLADGALAGVERLLAAGVFWAVAGDFRWVEVGLALVLVFFAGFSSGFLAVVFRLR